MELTATVDGSDDALPDTAQSEERLLAALQRKQENNRQLFIDEYTDLVKKTGWRWIAKTTIIGGQTPISELIPIQMPK